MSTTSSLFILFAPFDDPEIVVAVMVENAGYDAAAASTARKRATEP